MKEIKSKFRTACFAWIVLCAALFIALFAPNVQEAVILFGGPLVITVIFATAEYVHSRNRYLLFVESFDRMPPKGTAEEVASQAQVAKVLSSKARQLLELYTIEKEATSPTVEQTAETRQRAASAKKEIKYFRPRFRRMQNAAQHFGYKVPDQLVKVAKWKMDDPATDLN